MTFFADQCSHEYNCLLNEPFCVDATPLRSNGKPQIEYENSNAMLKTLQLLDICHKYTVSQAVFFLYLYKSLLIYYDWRREKCKSFEKLYQLPLQKAGDVQKIINVARSFKKKSYLLPQEYVEKVQTYFQKLFQNEDAVFEPERAWMDEKNKKRKL